MIWVSFAAAGPGHLEVIELTVYPLYNKANHKINIRMAKIRLKKKNQCAAMVLTQRTGQMAMIMTTHFRTERSCHFFIG